MQKILKMRGISEGARNPKDDPDLIGMMILKDQKSYMPLIYFK